MNVSILNEKELEQANQLGCDLLAVIDRAGFDNGLIDIMAVISVLCTIHHVLARGQEEKDVAQAREFILQRVKLGLETGIEPRRH